MRIESAGDVRAVSPKGAMGLMQIMPKAYPRIAGPPPSRHRRIQSARQQSRWRCLSSRDARSLRRAGVPCRLQCRPRPLRRASGDRAAAAARDADLRRDALPNDRRPTVRRPNRRLFRSARMDSRHAVRHARGNPAKRRIACRQSAAGSFVRYPSPRRSLGSRRSRRACSCTSPAGIVHNERNRAFHRTLARFVACSAVGLSRWRGVDHGRQDKSAASGRAHVLGWLGDFRRLTRPACWRFCQKQKRYQSSERHPWVRRSPIRS